MDVKKLLSKRLIAVFAITFFIFNPLYSQTTLFSEDFEAVSEGELSTTTFNGWKQYTVSATASDWSLTNNCPISGSYSMTLHAYGAYCEYAWDDTGNEVAYYASLIDATLYNTTTLSFDWNCGGETSYDYGRVCYSTNGTTWTDFTNSGTYVNAGTTSVTNLDISEVDGTSFYLGFRWINDSNTGTDPGMNVDNIIVEATANCTTVGGTASASTTAICSSGTTTLSLAGETASSTYQWQSSPDGSTWSNIGGATTDPYTTASISSTTYYQCVVTNGCPATSSSVQVTVSPNSVSGTSSVSSSSICSGNTVDLSLAGETGSIQWQSSPDGSTWSNIGGATTDPYTTAGITSNTYYRAVVTSGSCSSANSNSELVSVVTCVNMSNGSTTNCNGNFYDAGGPGSNYTNNETYTYTINPGGTVTINFTSFAVENHATCGYDYLSIYDGPSTASPLIGTYCNSSPGTIISSGGALTFYWDSDGGTVAAGWEANWSCCAITSGTAAVSPSSMCVAGNATLSLSGQGGGTTIQWQSSPDDATWTDIGGATSTSEVVAVASSTYYRAVVTNGCDSYTSSVYVSVGGTPIPTNYYVNDNSTTGDVYCNNVGNAANNGQNPCSPKTTLQDIFDTYDIDPGDTIFVDAGTYTMGVNITVASDEGSAAADVVIIGAGNTLTHITAPAADDNFYFEHVDYMLVKDMHLISTQSSNYNYFVFECNDHLIDGCHLEHSTNVNIYMNEAGGSSDIDDNSVANCTIDNSAASGYNIWIRGDADNDTIRNCVINSTGTTNAKAVVLNDYSIGLHDGWPTAIHMFGNTVTADDYGFYGDVVDGNTMELYDIHSNTFSIGSSNKTDGAAIWLDNHGLSSSDVSNIYSNIISGGKNGVYLTSGVDYCHFFNNFICNSEYGIYINDNGSNNNDYQHNSIYSSKECMHFTSDSKSSTYIRNNIFYSTSNSSYACVNAGNTSSTFIRSDYNLYYTPNGAYVAQEGLTFYNLAGWQGTDHHDGTGNGDNNSMVTDPNFQNAANCQLELLGNYQTGTSIAAVTSDIYGTARAIPTIGAWEENSTLAVTLVGAKGMCNNGIVKIEWATQSEINNDYFRIERSDDGFDFEVVGTVDGSGNSQLVNAYSFIDESQDLDLSYYRIVQVDYNGGEDVIETMIITCEDINSLEIVELYPNPTRSDITINIVSPNRDEVMLALYDASGKLIYNDGLSINEGYNLVNIPVDQYRAGVYLIKIINSKGTQSIKRFVKQ